MMNVVVALLHIAEFVFLGVTNRQCFSKVYNDWSNVSESPKIIEDYVLMSL